MSVRRSVRRSVRPSVRRSVTHELKSCKSAVFDQNYWQYERERILCRGYGLVLSGDDFTIIQQEILMMRDCRHENVVAYYGTYLRRDKLWICMEFCGGGSMQVSGRYVHFESSDSSLIDVEVERM